MRKISRIPQKSLEKAAQNGVSRELLLTRMNRGWGLEDAISTPPRKKNHEQMQNGKYYNYGLTEYWENIFREIIANKYLNERAYVIEIIGLHLDEFSSKDFDRKLSSHQKEIALRNDIPIKLVKERLNQGWEMVDALTVPVDVDKPKEEYKKIDNIYRSTRKKRHLIFINNEWQEKLKKKAAQFNIPISGYISKILIDHFNSLISATHSC